MVAVIDIKMKQENKSNQLERIAVSDMVDAFLLPGGATFQSEKHNGSRKNREDYILASTIDGAKVFGYTYLAMQVYNLVKDLF